MLRMELISFASTRGQDADRWRTAPNARGMASDVATVPRRCWRRRLNVAISRMLNVSPSGVIRRALGTVGRLNYLSRGCQ